MTRILAIIALLGGILLAAVWADNSRLRAENKELATQVRTRSAERDAAEVLARQRPRLEIRYREATQGLDPDALSKACLADPALLAAVDAARRMRDEYNRDPGRQPPR